MYRNGSDDTFTSPAANFWGVLAHMLQTFLNVRGKFSAEGNVYTDSAHVQSDNVEFDDFDALVSELDSSEIDNLVAQGTEVELKLEND